MLSLILQARRCFFVFLLDGFLEKTDFLKTIKNFS